MANSHNTPLSMNNIEIVFFFVVYLFIFIHVYVLLVFIAYSFATLDSFGKSATARCPIKLSSLN